MSSESQINNSEAFDVLQLQINSLIMVRTTGVLCDKSGKDRCVCVCGKRSGAKVAPEAKTKASLKAAVPQAQTEETKEGKLELELKLQDMKVKHLQLEAEKKQRKEAKTRQKESEQYKNSSVRSGTERFPNLVLGPPNEDGGIMAAAITSAAAATGPVTHSSCNENMCKTELCFAEPGNISDHLCQS